MKTKRISKRQRVSEAALMAALGASAGLMYAHQVFEVGPRWVVPVSAAVIALGIFLVDPLLRHYRR